MTVQIAEPTLTPTDAGDHDRFKHYVPKRLVTDAYIFGNQVTALCGKKWVPSADPERFPVCPDCQKAWEAKE